MKRRPLLSAHKHNHAAGFKDFCEAQEYRIFNRLFARDAAGSDTSIHTQDERRRAALARLREGKDPVEEMAFEKRGRA